MRTIRQLLENEETIWMYLNDEVECRLFFEQAHEEGFHFGDLPFEQWAPGYTVAVHKNGQMGHLPLFVWRYSWNDEKWLNIPGSHIPIDYNCYRSGSNECLCKEPRIIAKS